MAKKSKEQLDLEAAAMAGMGDGYDDDEFEVDPAARGDLIGRAEDEEPAQDTDDDDAEESDELEEQESEDEEEEDEADADEPEAAEEDPTEEPDADDEEEQAPRAKAKGKDEPRIPKSRFDEVNERRKAAERRLKELEEREKEAEQGVDFDFDAKEAEFMEAVLDGDKDKALAIRREIRAAERAIIEQQTARTSAATREQTKAELELQQAIDEAKSTYPAFDDASEAYSQDLTDEVLELFNGYVAQKYAPAVAMRKATRIVAKLHDLGAPSEAEAEEAPAPKASLKPGQVERKLKAAKRQPPQPKGRAEERTVDVLRMSEAEFEKLSEAELRAMRGDML